MRLSLEDSLRPNGSTIRKMLMRHSPTNLKAVQGPGKSKVLAEPLHASHSSEHGSTGRLLALQHVRGNRFVQRMLAAARTTGSNEHVPANVESSIQRARRGGFALDDSLRGRTEAAFGASFSGVRIHTDDEADMLNQALSARAFTVGEDIFFRRGEFNPSTSGGRELLAHELAHVIQQSDTAAQRPIAPRAEAAISGSAKGGNVQRRCVECDEESRKQADGGRIVQAKLMITQEGDPYEQEADAAADAFVRWEARLGQALDSRLARPDIEHHHTTAQPDRSQASLHISTGTQNGPTGTLIQRTPAPGGNFGTYRYCGFGITTSIPGFIKDLYTGSFDVDYTRGCGFVGDNAWASVWELYDASDRKLDSTTEHAFGTYTIESSDVNRGTPGDGSANWSLWYRVTKSQPWLTGDSDAYPYDYREFRVYSAPIRNPAIILREELGSVIWQDNFTPAEDGASLQYNFSVVATRATTDTQTTTASGTVAGDRSASFNFAYDGLTGGFANRLSYSATVSLSRTHSIAVSTSQSESKTFTQPNLRGGVTYRIIARPLYHIIDGSVDLIAHRDGVITGTGQTISGAIRVLKGLDVRIEGGPGSGGPGSGGQGAGPLARKWGCEDVRCNVQPARPGAACPDRVIGNSPYIYSNFDEACEAAKQNANAQVPEGCYKRHCDCSTKCTQR
jgi:Domain of unknown function (DUF4157)